MEFISIKEAARLWKVSEQAARKYLRRGQVPGAVMENGSWKVPANAEKPGRLALNEEKICEVSPLLKKLIYQQKRNNHYGIYEYLLLNMAYSSNRMASNRLTRAQVEMIHRAHRISPNFEPIKVDDILETVNHLNATDFIIKSCLEPLSPDYIKKIHTLLTYGTFFDWRKANGVGSLRNKPIKVHGIMATSPTAILRELHKLTLEYERDNADLHKILDFHVRLERIHPFIDYNGRVGRLIMLKECLRNNIDPFIIDDKRRIYYSHGIAIWDEDPSLLTNTVLIAQQRFQNQMDTCNKIEYNRPENPLRKM